MSTGGARATITKTMLGPLLVLLGSVACHQPPPTTPLSAPAPAPAPEPRLALVEPARPLREVAAGHLAFPSVLRLATAELLLVYREGQAHVDESGRIVGQRGSADGQRWSEPFLVFDTPGMDDRDPSLARVNDGSLRLTWFTYASALDDDGHRRSVHQVFMARSSADGASFTAASQVTRGPTTLTQPTGEQPEVSACSSPLIQLARTGQLLLPVYQAELRAPDAPGAPRRSWISLYASDDGATWERRVLAIAGGEQLWLQEPALRELRSGDLVLLARTATGDTPFGPGPLVWSRSSDGGTSWSPWQRFPVIGHAPDLLELRSGVLLAAFREVSVDYDHVWTSLSASGDGGRSWSTPLRVQDGGETDSGYPTMVELESGQVLVIFYANDGRSIDRAIVSCS